MRNATLCLLALLYLTSCSHTYYIVRHAEKAAPDSTMNTDVTLSDEGVQRALDLRDRLKNKRIRTIYSTNTVRTTSTALPLSTLLGIPISFYKQPDSTFFQLLHKEKKNTLIVGHSNTIDEIVNDLAGEKMIQDLEDNVYNFLFLVKYSVNGKVVRVNQFKYGR